MTLESDVTNPWNIGSDLKTWHTGGNIVLGYKLNPNISFGIGYGGSYSMAETNCIEHYYGFGDKTEEAETDRTEDYDVCNDAVMHKIFLRGQYRMNDNRFAPIVGLDVGYRIISLFDPEDYYEYIKHYSRYIPSADVDYDINKSSLFFNPSIGFSLRSTNNSYFEMKLGYSFYGKIDGRSLEDYDSFGQHFVFEQKDSNLSGLFITMGWTHTFGSRQR